MPKIVFYITSHGFGHATRQIEIINHIPGDADVEVVTEAPEWLFRKSISRPFDYTPLLHDFGVAQTDSLNQDLPLTLRRWNELLERYPAMLDAEAARLGRAGADRIAGDISPFAPAVAGRMGVESVITANFSWDWIFQAFLPREPAFQAVIDRVSEWYAETSLLLRTPLAGDLSVFPRIADIPLVVRRSNKSREEARAMLGLGMDERVVLATFGGHGVQTLPREAFAKRREIRFLAFDPALEGLDNVNVIDARAHYHPDLVRASDLAFTKLGYGIVTECIAHRVPMAHPPRADFPEYDVLERDSAMHVPTRRIEMEDFRSGRWGFLEDWAEWRETSPDERPAPAVGLNGGAEAARILMEPSLARA